MGRKSAGFVALFAIAIALAAGSAEVTSQPHGTSTGHQVVAEDRGPTLIGR
ncbi:hypothetical protein AB0L71_11630 [Streptomyces sp. NPDC052052]|uniref:hypothetical protein n=1 Tax=Streptomyces sp. NPDC052052 TaxID=3154756 RepID=UPI00343D3BE0